MRTSKVKTIITGIASAFVFCGVLACFSLGLDYLIAPADSYTRVMMHELYAQKKIDRLFCGASLSYRSFDTGLLDRELRCNCFNAGSSSQDVAVTYFLLKDILRGCDVGHVYLELSPAMEIRFGPDTTQTAAGVFPVFCYMRRSLPKLQMFLDLTRKGYALTNFLGARYYVQTVNIVKIPGNVSLKGTDEYKKYGYRPLSHDREWYAGKGYVESCERVYGDRFDDVCPEYTFASANDGWCSYVRKIISLCKQKDVEITLVCSPVSRYVLSSWDGWYDDYHAMVDGMAREAGIVFWDFSLVKDAFFNPVSENYQDSVHLNMYGARLFSSLFARIVRGELVYEDICCLSTDEKLVGSR